MLKFTRRWLFYSKRRPTIHESHISRSRFPLPEESVQHLINRDKGKKFDYFEMKNKGLIEGSVHDEERKWEEEEKEEKIERIKYINSLKKKGMKIGYRSSSDEMEGVDEILARDYKEYSKAARGGDDILGRKIIRDSFDEELFGLKKWDEYVKKQKEFEPVRPSEWIENVKPEWEEHISSWNLLNEEGEINENEDVLGKLEKMADEKLSIQKESYSEVNGNLEKSQNIDVLGELEKIADSVETFKDQNISINTEKEASLDIEELQNIEGSSQPKIFEFAALWLKDVDDMHKKLPKNKQNQMPKLGSLLDIANSNEFYTRKVRLSEEDLNAPNEVDENYDTEAESEDKYKDENIIDIDKDTDADEEIERNPPPKKRKPRRKKDNYNL